LPTDGIGVQSNTGISAGVVMPNSPRTSEMNRCQAAFQTDFSA
jgi:hypothetical protein